MIRLSRIDGMEILLNADLIRTVVDEEGVGTVIELDSGDNVVVKNQTTDVIQKVQAQRIGKSEPRKTDEKDKDNKDKEKKDKRDKKRSERKGY